MKTYIVWLSAPQQAGDTQFYEMYVAHNAEEAKEFALEDKRYPNAKVVRVVKW